MSDEYLNWIKQFDAVYIERLVDNQWQVKILDDCMPYESTGISLEDCIEDAALCALVSRPEPDQTRQSSEFSKFVRTASPEEKSDLFKHVIEVANEAQQATADSIQTRFHKIEDMEAICTCLSDSTDPVLHKPNCGFREHALTVGEGQTVAEKYHDLIYQVETKWPGETRHETAKRYIHERENQPLRCAEQGRAQGEQS